MGFILEILIVFAGVTALVALYQALALKRTVGKSLHVAAVVGILAMLLYFLVVLAAG